MIRKNLFLFLIITIPLSIIFLAFFRPEYGNLVRRSIIVFTILAVPYCLFVKDPRKGLLFFLLEASLLEGPWKHFAFGLNLKLLVYIIRDLLLYMTFFNFLLHKKRILPEDALRQRPPYTGLIFIFLLNIAIQIFNPAGYNYLSAILGSRLFWEMIPLYWMGFYLMRNKRNFKVLCWVCFLCISFNSIAAVLQYNFGSEKVALISEGYHAIVYEWGRGLGEAVRPPGLGADMGFAGGYFSQAVVMIIVLFITTQAKSFKMRLLNFICLTALVLVSIAGLIASASRSAIVISVISLMILFLLKRDLFRRRAVKIMIMSALLSFLIIPYMLDIFKMAARRYETIKSPKILMQTMTEVEKSRAFQAFILPLRYSAEFFMGNGLGKVGPGAGLFSGGIVAKTNAENALNLSITEIGTIGTILWLVFHMLMIKHGFRIYRSMSDPQWKWYGVVPLSYMLLMVLFWQFGHLISFPQNAGFWFMSGSLMGLKYIKE